MPRLIIFDLYGTLVRADVEDLETRPGFNEFFDFYKGKTKMVVCTDGEKEIVEETLKRVGLNERFDGFYCSDYLFEADGGQLKDLSKILVENSIPAKNSVFIGDNYLGCDECSAFYARVPFIRVPQFRDSPPSSFVRRLQGDWTIYDSLDKPFTFKSLIGKI